MNFCSVYKSISFSVLVEIICFYFFSTFYISLCALFVFLLAAMHLSINQSIHHVVYFYLSLYTFFSLCLCLFLHLLISLSMPIFLLPCYPYALHRTNYLYLSLCVSVSLSLYIYIHIYIYITSIFLLSTQQFGQGKRMWEFELTESAHTSCSSIFVSASSSRRFQVSILLTPAHEPPLFWSSDMITLALRGQPAFP